MKKLLAFSLLFLTAFVLRAQNDEAGGFAPQYKKGVRYVVKTTAGTAHNGYVVNETKEAITLENRNLHEKIDIRKSEILSAKAMPDRKAYENDVLGENKHADCYFFASSALELEPGKIYSRNHWLLLQNADYAITQNWALSTHAIAFYPVSIGVKTGYRVSDRGYVGGSFYTMGNILNSNPGNPSLFGFSLMGRYTQGNTNRNFTAGAGVLALNTALFGQQGTPSVILPLPFLNLAFCNRFTSNLVFVTEGWYFPQVQTLLGMAGVKLINNENYAWTFGVLSFVNNFDKGIKLNLSSLPIPYIGINRRF